MGQRPGKSDSAHLLSDLTQGESVKNNRLTRTVAVLGLATAGLVGGASMATAAELPAPSRQRPSPATTRIRRRCSLVAFGSTTRTTPTRRSS